MNTSLRTSQVRVRRVCWSWSKQSDRCDCVAHLCLSSAEEVMSILMPIFETLRQQESLPCSYPLAMGGRQPMGVPITAAYTCSGGHWVSFWSSASTTSIVQVTQASQSRLVSIQIGEISYRSWFPIQFILVNQFSTGNKFDIFYIMFAKLKLISALLVY